MFPSSPPLPAPLLANRQTQTVSELTSSITVLLENEFPFVAVSGEISNVRRPYSGHTYFTLKDSEAQIRCVLFKSQQRYLAQPLEGGARVICRGRISVYRQRGEYQIIVDHVSDGGLGDLQRRFDMLKDKLLTEGLFAREAKKKLPAFVGRICLITSPSGAAVYDFLRTAQARFAGLQVEILPAAVQGASAAREIIRQIDHANKRAWAEVIVLTRGGGSLEDLAAFNDEELARAIYASQLPVVSAVGHEVDFTIADFVADQRSPTPTAAAQEIVFDKDEVVGQLSRLQEQMVQGLQSTLRQKEHRLAMTRKHLADPRRLVDHYQLKVDHVSLNLIHCFARILERATHRLDAVRHAFTDQAPERKIAGSWRHCETLRHRLDQAMKNRLQGKSEEIARHSARLDALSPLAVLGRGYALAFTEEGRIIRGIDQVKRDDPITIRVADGTIAGMVKKTTRK